MFCAPLYSSCKDPSRQIGGRKKRRHSPSTLATSSRLVCLAMHAGHSTPNSRIHFVYADWLATTSKMTVTTQGELVEGFPLTTSHQSNRLCAPDPRSPRIQTNGGGLRPARNLSAAIFSPLRSDPHATNPIWLIHQVIDRVLSTTAARSGWLATIRWF